MTRNCPSVSVVIPCYNVEHYVARAIDDVLGNRNVVVEIIAVDDGSADGTLAAIDAYGSRVRVLSGTHAGACAARNKGLAIASAPFVVFMDADDGMGPEMLEAALRAVNGSDIDLAFGPSLWVYPQETVRYGPPEVSSAEAAVHFLFTRRFVQTGSIIWRTDFCRRIGGWREGIHRKSSTTSSWSALSPTSRIWPGVRPGNVYNQLDREGRITNNTTDVAFESMVQVARLCRDYIAAMGLSEEEVDLLLRPYCYWLWRSAATDGSTRVEVLARELYHSVGGCRHFGGWNDRLLASLLGLRRKQQLSRHLRSALGVREREFDT